MSTLRLLLPIVVGFLAPLPEDLSPMDCLCAFNAYSVSTVPHATTPNSNPDVYEEYSSDAQSGQCDGTPVVCPTVGECVGKGKLHVVSKPFTQLGEGQGATFGVDNVGTYDHVATVSGCGFVSVVWLTVFASTTGNVLGTVKLVIRCSRCSDTK
ncbi:MAG: hypothetical protein K8J09_05270, partial [Planctomycetes bacterium]|nr:hypothetical protein [Planctomycetota bacterium]